MTGDTPGARGLRTQSPCINVCEMDEKTGFCKGCYRTIDEIIDWTVMTAAEKTDVNYKTDQRRLSADTKS